MGPAQVKVIYIFLYELLKRVAPEPNTDFGHLYRMREKSSDMNHIPTAKVQHGNYSMEWVRLSVNKCQVRNASTMVERMEREKIEQGQVDNSGESKTRASLA